MFLLKSNRYFNYEEGLFQFAQKNRPKKKSLTTKRSYRFGNFRRLYYTGASAEKKRRARYWMRTSNTKITQTVIDNFFLKNMDKAFSKIK